MEADAFDERPIDDATRALGTATRVAVAAVHRRLRLERGAGHLGERAMAVLERLVQTGSTGLSELSASEGVTLATMSQTVNRLEAGGYLTRTAHPSDRRRVVFVPTEAGTAIAREGRARRHHWFDAQLADLDPDEQASLRTTIRLLHRIADSPPASPRGR